MLKDKLSVIEGLDYDAALMNSAGEEEFLKEILMDICEDSAARIDRMKSCLKEGNYKDYGIEAHAVKGLMATIGVERLKEHAKKHEFAAKEDDHKYIDDDFEEFLGEYGGLCDKIKAVIG
ncbi:MAG: hypothetical protein K6E98_08585 [Lachnospiraceae bacterium]|nr:hypothetical protein [Lachnospiraceae bacterium]